MVDNQQSKESNKNLMVFFHIIIIYFKTFYHTYEVVLGLFLHQLIPPNIQKKKVYSIRQIYDFANSMSISIGTVKLNYRSTKITKRQMRQFYYFFCMKNQKLNVIRHKNDWTLKPQGLLRRLSQASLNMVKIMMKSTMIFI
jgi:hypothetical protein